MNEAELLEMAWGIICNASNRPIEEGPIDATPGWSEAAIKLRREYFLLMERKADKAIDCRSEQGITVGLIDAIISISRIVARRNLKPPAVEEALLDLYDDEDLHKLRVAAMLIEARRDREQS